MLSSKSILADDVRIVPLSQTDLPVMQTEILAYIGGGYSRHGNLWIANNIPLSTKNIYGSFLHTGIEAEFYNTYIRWLHFGGNVGYRHEVFSYNNNVFNSTGVYTYWLTTDIYSMITYWGLGLSAGLKSDFFLFSKIHNNDHFSYEGLNSECFNKMNICWFVGLNACFTHCRFEARIGSYIVPQLNPQKISYYNMHSTHVNNLYFEIKAYCRLFTTGNKYGEIRGRK